MFSIPYQTACVSSGSATRPRKSTATGAIKPSASPQVANLSADDRGIMSGPDRIPVLTYTFDLDLHDVEHVGYLSRIGQLSRAGSYLDGIFSVQLSADTNGNLGKFASINAREQLPTDGSHRSSQPDPVFRIFPTKISNSAYSLSFSKSRHISRHHLFI